MEMYAIMFEGDSEAEIVSGREALDECLKEMFKDGYWAVGEKGPDIYKLEEKMTVHVKLKITRNGE